MKRVSVGGGSKRARSEVEGWKAYLSQIIPTSPKSRRRVQRAVLKWKGAREMWSAKLSVLGRIPLQHY